MERILVRAPNWLGDAVMSTPFLKRTIARHSPHPVDVAARPGLKDFFRSVPGVAEVVTIPASGPLSKTVFSLKARGYSTAYVLPPSFSSALLCWRAGIPRRVGYASDGRSILLTDVLPLDERYHYVRRYMGLLGLAHEDLSPGDFHVPRLGEAETEVYLKSVGVSFTGQMMVLAPGSRAPARRWFPERFAQTVEGLGDEWSDVVLMGAPEDRPVAAEVARLCRRPTIDLCGLTSLPQAASILSRAAALITNESGLMHIGWAVGTPMVVVAGPSNPRVTSPFGPRVSILQSRLPCVPCVKNDCPLVFEDHQACLKEIHPPQVLIVLSRMSR